jgi:ribosomal protein L11 methyltransferase
VQARHFDLLHDGPTPSAPTVVANRLRSLLLHVARVGFAGETPRVLVASGLLAHEADEVAAAFATCGLHERARRHAGGWGALTLVAM